MEKLHKLHEICSNCQLCDLAKSRTKVVFGKGNIKADILFIGEAPGEKEDLEGIPFVGKAGKKLDELLNQINLKIEDVYIANILKCRPPKNRDPSIDEIKKCTPYLIEQIKIIRPKIIITLGNYSSKFVLSGFNVENMKKIKGISDIHGQIVNLNIEGIDYKIVPIYHPAAMMYKPSIREKFENDFKVIEKLLQKFN
jgi:uracil-DNA glycosylase family 4